MDMDYERKADKPGELALRWAAEWVVRLNDPAVTETDFLRWQAWLAESPANSSAFQDVQDTWQRSASVSQISSASARKLEGMREEVDALLDSSRRRRAFARRFAATAAVVLVAVLGTLLWREDSDLVETTTAELRSVRLPDGSRAALGPRTRIEIDFSERIRSLRMSSGEAYFEVAHAPQRPFSVITPSGRIIAVGTAFSVHTIEGRVRVSVTEGVVRVEPVAPADPAAAVFVTAGHRYVRDHARTQIEPIVVADATAWQQGKLQYQGEPLRVVVSDINRYSPLQLRIADPALGELRYTGTVFPESLDAWLASMPGTFPVRIESHDTERLIVRAEPVRGN